MKFQGLYSSKRRLLVLSLLALTIIVGFTLAFTFGRTYLVTFGDRGRLWSAGTTAIWEAGIGYKGIDPHVQITNTNDEKGLTFFVSISSKDHEGVTRIRASIFIERLPMLDLPNFRNRKRK